MLQFSPKTFRTFVFVLSDSHRIAYRKTKFQPSGMLQSSRHNFKLGVAIIPNWGQQIGLDSTNIYETFTPHVSYKIIL